MLFETLRAIMQAMTEKLKRRLTTVLCADVQGYSRLMEADEAGTLATLRRYRTAMAALIERHDGRIVNTWGDAVIAEFASVVEAVQCAIEIQQELSAQDPHLPEAQRMRFRIGINLGDVMVDGSDIYDTAGESFKANCRGIKQEHTARVTCVISTGFYFSVTDR
jgi:adenylate cyclase